MAKKKRKSKSILVTKEQKIAAIQKFTLFSDVFARVVFEDVAACEYVLRILTKNNNLRLNWVKTQFVRKRQIARLVRSKNKCHTLKNSKIY